MCTFYFKWIHCHAVLNEYRHIWCCVQGATQENQQTGGPEEDPPREWGGRCAINRHQGNIPTERATTSQHSMVSIFSSPEPKARVSYCHSAPSVVRPSGVKFSHFRLLLQNRLMNFDETWYAWSTHGPLQVLLFFGQIRPGADPGRGRNRSRGVPFFKKLLLQTGRLPRQTECIAMT